MYSSLGQILRGWSRIFYGTFGTARRLLVSLAVLVIMGVLPYLAAPLAWAMWAPGTASGALWLATALVSTAAAAAQLTVMMRFFPLTGSRASLGLTYPLGCCVAIWAVLSALGKLRKGGQITWRGTAYSTAPGPAPAGTNADSHADEQVSSTRQ
jgi:hypothetical protein